MGFELKHWPSLVYKSDADPTELSRHVLKVSDFQILIKSCSIESRNDPSPKSEVVHETKFSLKISYSTHACLAQLDGIRLVIQWWSVLWVQIPLEATLFFLRHLDANFVQKCQKCQICVIYENLEWEWEIVYFIHYRLQLSHKDVSKVKDTFQLKMKL